MYPSDYGYATSGGSTTDRVTCLAKYMQSWAGSDVSDCKNNDYLFKGVTEWTLAPVSSYSNLVYRVFNTGYVGNFTADYTAGVRPVVFLKSNISITDAGIGTAESPFQLKVG